MRTHIGAVCAKVKPDACACFMAQDTAREIPESRFQVWHVRGFTAGMIRLIGHTVHARGSPYDLQIYTFSPTSRRSAASRIRPMPTHHPVFPFQKAQDATPPCRAACHAIDSSRWSWSRPSEAMAVMYDPLIRTRGVSRSDANFWRRVHLRRPVDRPAMKASMMIFA